MTDQSKFLVHHVGGRGGSVVFPTLTQFNEDISQVIYDADESCLEQVQEKWQGRDVAVYPYCLSDKNGPSKFHINYCPFTSSLYPSNKSFGNFYEEYGNFKEIDYLFEFSLHTERVVDVDTFSLDYLVQSGKVPSADFLSIDTQGAELVILKGGNELLRSRTVAVMCEINFTNLYNGVPLFGELDAFLRSHNFMLATLTPLEFGYKRIPKAFRGKGMPLQGEALYLLRPESVSGMDAEKKARLEKLAFASIAFGFTELASDALEKAAVIPGGNEKKRKYQKFLTTFQNELGKKTDLPKLWNESVSFEQSLQRFEANAVNDQSLSYMIRNDFMKKRKVIFKRVFKGVLNRIKRVCNSILALISIQVYGVYRQSSFEKFLRSYGFDIAAEEVHKRRHA